MTWVLNSDRWPLMYYRYCNCNLPLPLPLSSSPHIWCPASSWLFSAPPSPPPPRWLFWLRELHPATATTVNTWNPSNSKPITAESCCKWTTCVFTLWCLDVDKCLASILVMLSSPEAESWSFCSKTHQGSSPELSSAEQRECFVSCGSHCYNTITPQLDSKETHPSAMWDS